MYEYHDGNANRYIIENETIEYIPIKPSQSSSGIYDGGDYVKKEISKSEFDQISSVLVEAINNNACHIRVRVKMSGRIIAVEGDNKNSYLLNPYSEEKEKIEKCLQDVIEVKK
jgi:hypothetical protein